MFRLGNLKYILISVILFTIFILLFYPKLFKSNQFLIDGSADGLKNYYTYIYYIEKDTSFINSTSVNYPYGEFISYLDCQPLISVPLKVLYKIFKTNFIKPISILNYILFFNFIVTIICLFYIFIEFKINKWYALFFSFIVTLLSPQFYRVGGHFGLSYSFIFPLIILLIIKLIKEPTIKKVLILTLINFLFFFLHAYLSMISIFFQSIFIVLYIILYFKKINLRLLLFFSIQIFLPIILFFIINNALDYHSNRSDSPAGIYYYIATLKTVFLPYEDKLMKPYSLFFTNDKIHYEGNSYVGLLTNLLLAFFILLILVNYIRKRKFVFKDILKKELIFFLISSIVLLIFSFGLFYNYGFSFLLDIFKPLRQFRALGRFTWPFYYTINIIIFILFYHLTTKIKKTFLKICLLLLLFIPIYEIIVFHNQLSQKMFLHSNVFEKRNLTQKYIKILDSINFGNYQAFIPIPLFHFGSEDFMIESPLESQYNSMVFSYYSGLSYISCNSGRTSVDEAKKIIQVIAPIFYKKEIENNIISNKPFLILKTNVTINDYERNLLERSKKIFTSDDIELYEITKERLFEYSSKCILNSYINLNDSTHIVGNLVLNNINSKVFYENFDNIPSKIKQFGSGAYKKSLEQDKVVYSFKIENLDSSQTYELNFWIYNKIHSVNRFMVVLEETNIKNESKWINVTDGRFCNIIYGDWSLLQFFFRANNGSEYKLYIPGQKDFVDSIYLDNLLVRPINIDIYTVVNVEGFKKGFLLYNNQIIETDYPYLLLKCSRELFINRYSEDIKSSTEWKKICENYALKKKISVDSAIFENALFMYFQNKFDVKNIEPFIIDYYTNLIKNDSEWYKYLIERSDNKNKKASDIIYENALYMFNQFQKYK